jgi:hypothetical protein
MKAWTLRQLKFAHEVCFPETFIRIWSQIESRNDALYHVHELKKNGLLPWIFMYSRADYENGLGDMIDTLLTELIGDYE